MAEMDRERVSESVKRRKKIIKFRLNLLKVKHFRSNSACDSIACDADQTQTTHSIVEKRAKRPLTLKRLR